jgi:dTDP-4-amino-4,6-dideoxygalactose transaminase
MSFYKEMGYTIKNYPVTYENYACEISLPVYYDLTDQQVKSVIRAVLTAINETLC